MKQRGEERFLVLRLVLSLTVLVGGLWWALGGANHLRLQNALTNVESDTVTLESTVPFPWDTVYTFDADVTQAEMEIITGADCTLVPEAEDGEERLVFLLQGSVVCAVLENPEEDGYHLELPEERPTYSALTYGEKQPFTARRANGVVTFTPTVST